MEISNVQSQESPVQVKDVQGILLAIGIFHGGKRTLIHENMVLGADCLSSGDRDKDRQEIWNALRKSGKSARKYTIRCPDSLFDENYIHLGSELGRYLVHERGNPVADFAVFVPRKGGKESFPRVTLLTTELKVGRDGVGVLEAAPLSDETREDERRGVENCLQKLLAALPAKADPSVTAESPASLPVSSTEEGAGKDSTF